MNQSNQESHLEWPPPYQIKVSRRAKRVCLSITREKGVTITVPAKVRAFNPMEIINDHRAWLEKKISDYLIPDPSLNEKKWPVILEMKALQKTYTVEYQLSSCDLQLIERPHTSLVLVGKLIDKNIIQLLKNWLKQTAYLHFEKRLSYWSEKMLCSYTELHIRQQKTCWGSCSTKKSIQLNYKLIFVPIHLLDYIIVHELAHTKHMNHSNKFWNLVAYYIPNYQLCKKELNQYSKVLPTWL